jgi:hypothetical protein
MSDHTCDVSWLPPLEPFDGDWDAYLDRIYAIFNADFIAAPPKTAFGKRFALKRLPIARGKEATFWHMIQEGKIEEERTPDFRRCERIRWPRCFIDQAENGELRTWRQVRNGSEQRIVVALKDFSYVLVLADRGDYILPWTAFWVQKMHQREVYRREWKAFHNKG